MKEDYIYYYKKRLIKKGIEDIAATKLAEDAWLKYYSENKEELDLRLKRDKSWFEKSIDSEFFNWLVKSKPERSLYASSSAAYPVSLQGKENKI